MPRNLELALRIKADLDRAVADLVRLNKQIDRTGDEAAQTGRQTREMAGGMERMRSAADRARRSMSGLFAGLSAGALIAQIVQVNRRFQDLEAGLETATGSAAAAAAAMAELRVFARETPFELAEVATAFIRLKNLGLDASAKSLRAFGDVAASIPNKSLIDFIEAVADAAVGEFERLKEFGIRARQQGDKVSFTFRGVTRTVAKNAREIQDYLRQMAETNFAGAMIRRMESIGGATSNLKDAFDDLFVAIGEAGVNDAVIAALRGLGAAVSTVGDNLGAIGDAALVAGAAIGGIAAARGVTAILAVFQARVAHAAVGLRLMSTFGSAAAARMVALSAATGAASLAARGLRAALAFVGGPLGLAIGVTSAAAALLATRQDAAADAAERHSKAIEAFDAALDPATGKLNEMTAATRALTRARLEDARVANQLAREELLEAARRQSLRTITRADQVGSPDNGSHFIDNAPRLPEIVQAVAKGIRVATGAGIFPSREEAARATESVLALQRQFINKKITGEELFTEVQALTRNDGRLKPVVDAIREWADGLIAANKALGDIDKRVARLDADGQGGGGGGRPSDDDAPKNRDDTAKAIAGLERQIALYGGLTHEERVLWETQEGRWKAASEIEKERLLGLARHLDLLDELKREDEETARRERRAADARKAAIEDIEAQALALLPAYERERAEIERQLEAQLAALKEEGKGYEDTERRRAEAREVAAERIRRLDEEEAERRRQAAEEEEQRRRDVIEAAEDEAERRLRASRHWRDGAIRGLRDYAEAATDAGKRAEDGVTSGIKSMEDALVEFVTTGKLSVSDFADHIIAEMARAAIQQSITGPLASGLSGLLTTGLGSLVGGYGVFSPYNTAGPDGVVGSVFHTGGVAGEPGGTRRVVAPAVFAGARRYHRGGIAGMLRPEEIPAILERGEEVIPARDPRHRANLAAASAAAPTVIVNIDNRDGPPQREVNRSVRWDGKRAVVDIVTENIADGGNIAKAIDGRRRGGY